MKSKSKIQPIKLTKNFLQPLFFLLVFISLIIIALFTPNLTNSKDFKARLLEIKPDQLKTIADKNSDYKGENLKLIFVGDIMLARKVGARIKQENNPEFPFLKVKEFLAQADITFGNLESPISDQGIERGHLYSFRAEPQSIKGLKSSGFDIVSLANNHAYDWGSQALIDTINRLNEQGIQTVGAGKDLNQASQGVIFQIRNKKIAYLAFTDIEPKAAQATAEKPGVFWYNSEILTKIINQTKKQADLVIVSAHSGLEYQSRPNQHQQKIYRDLIKAGADLVIGHHPHVRQTVEKYQNGYIFYSLGNFVFDQNWSTETSLGNLLEINYPIKNNLPLKIKLYQVKIDQASFQPSLDFLSQQQL